MSGTKSWVAAALAWSCFVTFGSVAMAVTFVTDSVDVATDVNPGDGVCATASGECSLTAAIAETEALPGADEIVLSTLRHELHQLVTIEDTLHVTGPGTIVPWPQARIAVGPQGDLRLSFLELEGALRVEGGWASLHAVRLAAVRPEGSLTVWSGVLEVRESSFGESGHLAVHGGRATIERTVLGHEPNAGLGSFVDLTGGSVVLRDVDIKVESTIPGAMKAVSMSGGRLELRESQVETSCSSVIDAQDGDVLITDVDMVSLDAPSGCSPSPARTAVDISSGSAVIRDSTFTGQVGRSVALDATSRGIVERCRFWGVAGRAIESWGSLTLSDSQVHQGGSTWGGSRGGWWHGGGGVKIAGGTATISRCEISGNRNHHDWGHSWNGRRGMALGGGLLVDGGNVTVTDTSITENRVTGAQYGAGGGVAVRGGTLRLERCLVARNIADGDGGGVAALGGTTTLVNSTVADNTAFMATDLGLPGNDVVYGGRSGGVFADQGTLQVLSSTIAGNGITGVFVEASASVSVGSSILADSDSDCEGEIFATAPNLIEEVSSCVITGDLSGLIVGVDPVLGALTPSGTSSTLPLLAGSPAIDAGGRQPPDDGVLGTLISDQRGVIRLADGDGDGVARVDLGAHEVCDDDQPDSDGDGVGDACDAIPCAAPGGVRVERALRVSTLRISWDAAPPLTYDLHEGALFTLRTGGRHEAVSCDAPTSPVAALPTVAGDAYYLIGARCGALRSPLGHSSDGMPRAAASVPCP